MRLRNSYDTKKIKNEMWSGKNNNIMLGKSKIRLVKSDDIESIESAKIDYSKPE